MIPSRRVRAVLLAIAIVAAVLGGLAPAASADGYWLAGADGSIYPFGGAVDRGSLTRIALNQPVVCVASTPSGGGYWMTARDGGIFNFGDAAFLGSTGGIRLNQPIVGMAATPSGRGHWLVARDGGVFSFGDATFSGSTGSIRLNAPILGMASTPTGGGYWLVARDGGVFTFGDGVFFGSTGSLRLNQPVAGMIATPSGRGYWLVGIDGGVFTFGDAVFAGSAAAQPLDRPVIGIAGTGSGNGYRMVASDGGVFTFGDATFSGSAARSASDGIVGLSPVGLPGSCGGSNTAGPLERLSLAQTLADGRAGTTGIAMGDATRGDVVGNPASHALMRSASIVKVLIGMALFARAEREGRGLNIDEQSDLRNMIRVSDNNAATRLWASLGGPAVISWVRGVTGIQETQPPAIGGQWGFTLTDAHDMAVILTSLAQARGINANDRNALLSEMRQVTPGQRWGISPAVLRSTPAVKNGWYPDTDAPVWRVHCTGVVDEGGRPNRWGIAVMTRYPIGLGMIYGEDTCQRVADLALAGDS
jgi:hypothetical protein